MVAKKITSFCRYTRKKCRFQTTDCADQCGLWYSDLTACHQVSDGSLVINWTSVCIVLYCIVVFNMSKFILNKEHLWKALIICFTLRKLLLNHIDYFKKWWPCSIARYMNDGFSISKVTTLMMQTRKIVNCQKKILWAREMIDTKRYQQQLPNLNVSCFKKGWIPKEAT